MRSIPSDQTARRLLLALATAFLLAGASPLFAQKTDSQVFCIPHTLRGRDFASGRGHNRIKFIETLTNAGGLWTRRSDGNTPFGLPNLGNARGMVRGSQLA